MPEMMSHRPATAADTIALAQRLAAAGEPAAAARAYRAVLARQPEQLAAMIGLARAQIALGEADAAEALIAHALAGDPSVAELHSLRGGLAMRRGDAAAALASFETALALAPARAPFHHNRAEALAALGRIDEALAGYRAALAIAESAASWSALGALLLLRGDGEAAAALAAAAALLPPAAREAAARAAARARAAFAAGDAAAAEAGFREALAAGPCDAALINDFGAALVHCGQPEAAIARFRQALVLDPCLAPAHNNLGNVLAGLRAYDQAIEAYGAALALAPEFAEAHANLGCALIEAHRPDEALPHLERALALDAALPEPRHMRGQAQIMLGDLAAARRDFADAAALAPDNPSFYGGLALTTALAPDSPEFARLTALTARREDDAGRATLHFALYRTLEKQGDLDGAFAHLAAGNRIRRAHIPHDPAAAPALFAAVAAAFGAARLAAAPPRPAAPDVPIFILGMPRSGSTLVEQIISSHPAVAAAGEVPLLMQIAAPHEAAPYPDRLDGWSPDEFVAAGARYREQLQALHAGASRITDKMLGNVLHIGFIRLALPGARIIHTRRDPLETCFSCFAQTFSAGIPYVNDLAELGAHYRAYAALMAHWRAALPEPFMYELDYETLIEDFEPQVRRLLDYCGLDFHEDCLRFHENKRVVFTASGTQVRRPLYRDALRRAQAYGGNLDELRTALGLSSAFL
jgi:tetratricopeptide (TPR) repeat protein